MPRVVEKSTLDGHKRDSLVEPGLSTSVSIREDVNREEQQAQQNVLTSQLGAQC